MATQVRLSTDQPTTLDEATLIEFKAKLRGEVVTPENSNYDEIRLIWNGMHDKRPALIARCTGVADVIDAVNFAREHHLLVAVRGGGHNVAGSASCDGGIMIDLSLMKGVHVDPQARTARVQRGATWGDVDRETQVWGLATPGGVVSTTGVGGLTLGGGLGWLRRKHGLTIDNLLSVEIVTADGQVHSASKSENTDLFWAIRGGGNFGIVTSFEFRLHPVGPTVMLCAPWYPAEDAKEILMAWRKFMESAPEELSSNLLFWTVPAVPGFPESAQGRRALILAAVYSGPADEGAQVVQPLRELGTPLLDLSGPLPWTVMQGAFDPFFPKGKRRYYFKSRYLKNLDDDTIDALLPRAINPPVPSVLIGLWHYGGAMQRVENTETAFMGRDAPYLFSVDAIWDDPSMSDEVLAYSRAYLAEMEPYSPGGLYVNFAGFGEEGQKLVRSAYGENYARPSQIKQQYDPNNLFRMNQNIVPALADSKEDPSQIAGVSA
jgi:FAD/FMN-containing dehydrogenase